MAVCYVTYYLYYCRILTRGGPTIDSSAKYFPESAVTVYNSTSLVLVIQAQVVELLCICIRRKEIMSDQVLFKFGGV